MLTAEKKFRRTAMAAVSVLLAVLLLVINGVNFTMAGEDADEITQRIAESRGEPGKQESREALALWRQQRPEGPRGMGPLGPDSPELFASMRFFTVAFAKGEEARLVAYEISAVTKEEALQWAESLKKESTGWTRGSYRYRVYKAEGVTYVTVIDQGRELTSCYRLLVISGVGFLLCLLVVWLVLRSVGKRLFAPLEEADRRQRRLIAKLEQSFRLPLALVAREIEGLERRFGPSEEALAIRQQVKGMSALVADLGSLAIFPEEDLRLQPVELTALLRETGERHREAFREKGLALELDSPEPVTLRADPEALGRVLEELFTNALRFSRSRAAFRLRREGERVTLTAENDTELPEGSADQIFDRFTTLGNGTPGPGLGLTHVKEIVRAHQGRVSAGVTGGVFRLRITL